jgi:hypothetical protein
MRRARRWVGGALIVASLIASSGCGGESKPPVETSTTTGEAKVTGTVKIHGLAMNGGKITFDPSNNQRKNARPRSVVVRKDGTFEVTTLVGANTVKISGPAVKKEPVLGNLPKTVDVQPGENRIEISYPD